MQDHTPEFSQPQLDFNKLCECGCGLPAPIAKRTHKSYGHIKGQPIRFIRNHHTRVQPSQAPWVAMYGLLQPYGKCQCGCNQNAPIAKCTRKPLGIKQGEPTRFIHAHGGRVQEHPSRPIDERFWEYARRGSDPDDCWEWIGPVDDKGYGRLTVDGKSYSASKISYILHCGPIPKGELVCHDCDNPPCTNPVHLFSGTSADNVADMHAKWRHAHGVRHWKAKLTEADVIQIRALHADGVSQTEIAKQYGVSQVNIGRIVHRKNWKHVP